MIEMQVLLGRLLVESQNPTEKASDIRLLEKLAQAGCADAKAELAKAIRTVNPTTAHALPEEASGTCTGVAMRDGDKGRWRAEE